MHRKVPLTELVKPAVIRTWLSLAATVLVRDRELLNSVNVFPVADADTGTNMAVTMRAAAAAAVATPDTATVAEVLASASRGALSGARGNSGVILSEWLRGFALAVGKHASVGHALHAAADAAWTAVVEPAPGSILTAMRAAADAALKVEMEFEGDPLQAAVVAARAATENSPLEQDVLAQAGVVDAGACGFVLLLDALQVLVSALHRPRGAKAQPQVGAPGGDTAGAGPTGGESAATEPTAADVQLGFELRPAVATSASGTGAAGGAPSNTDEFEVMFNLSRPADADDYQAGTVVRLLREQLAALGDSVVVIGGSATDIDIPCKSDFTARAAAHPTSLLNEDQPAGIPSAWHAHVHVKKLKPVLALINRWRDQGVISSEQIRYLAAPSAGASIWVATSDAKVVQSLAEFGVVVQLIPQGDTNAAADFARSLLGEIAPNVLALVPSWIGADAVREQLAAGRASLSEDGLAIPEDIELVEVADDKAVIDYLLDKMDAGAGA